MDAHQAAVPDLRLQDIEERKNASAPSGRVAFALLLLLTAVIFIRPTDLVPACEGLPIYEAIIVACAVATGRSLLQQLSWRSLASQPGAICVLGFGASIVFTNLSKGDLWHARVDGLAFVKIVVFYVLVLSLVDTPVRFRLFLAMLAVFIASIATLSLLQWHSFIDIPTLSAYKDHYGTDDDSGAGGNILRLRATGIFNDPNDFSLVLGAGMLIGLQFLLAQRRLVRKALWLPPMGVLCYAFSLTRSRGGFLGVLAGAAVFAIYRLGWRRAIPVAVLALPLLLWAFGGRQTDIDISNRDDTSGARVLLWRDSLVLFRRAPLFGIGSNQLAEANGLVAHNSYVHAFAEVGLVGGTFFIGAIYIPLSAIRNLKSAKIGAGTDNSDLMRWQPCIAAITVSYAVGIFSLTRCYTLTTYLILGIAGAFCKLMRFGMPAACPPLSPKLIVTVITLSVLWLAFLHLFVRVFA